jgi:hypothetical protein
MVATKVDIIMFQFLKKILAIIQINMALTFSAIAASPESIQGSYRCPQGITAVITNNEAILKFPKLRPIDAPHSRTVGKVSLFGNGDHVELGVNEMPYGDIVVSVFEEPANVNSRANDIVCLKFD